MGWGMLDSIGSVGGYSPSPMHAVAAPAGASAFSSVTTADITRDPASAVFYSPSIKIDPESQIAIYEQVDPTTGAIINQFPSKEAVAQYQRSEAQAHAPVATPAQVQIVASAPTATSVLPITLSTPQPKASEPAAIVAPKVTTSETTA